MIIVRSPLRITLGGGGTDLPSYYREHDGFLIAAAIDKYVYITLHKSFQPGYIIKYSELERVNRASEIRHPIVRAAIELVGARTASRSPAWRISRLGPASAHRAVLRPHCFAPCTPASATSFPAMRSLSKPATSKSTYFANRSVNKTSSSRPTGASPASSSIRTTALRGTAAAISQEVLDNLEDGLCTFLHRLYAVGFRHLERPGRQIEGKGRSRVMRQFAFHQGPRPAKLHGTSARRPSALCRANG